MPSTVLFEVSGAVAWIRLNRPERRNALTYPMLDDLLEVCELVANDSITRAVVITGVGDAFCSGGDVDMMLANAEDSERGRPDREQVKRLVRWHRIAALLHDMPKPTIAAVNGPVVGGGLGLALSCDLRVMKASATLRSGFASMAASGDLGGTWFATRLAGFGRARDLYLLDETIPASRALEWGLVSAVVPDDEFDGYVDKLADRLAHGPTRAFGFMKENLRLAETAPLGDVLEQEAELMIRSFRTTEHEEAARAFVERRPPRFELPETEK